MPRMRLAARSGWNGSSASSFSPTPTNLSGWPVTWRMESAAPPRASPSILVRMTPVMPRRLWNSSADFTASWPVMASATNRISTGLSCSLSCCSSVMSWSSMCRRPAVSTSSTSRPLLALSRRAERARSSGWRLSGRAFVDRLADIARDHPELLARGRAVDVHRNHHGAVAVLRKPARQLAGGGGFARALQPDDQENAGRLVGEAQLGFVAAQDLDQLLVNDLDDLLGGRKRAEHFLAHGLDFDVLDELFDDLEVDVGFEQRHADFAQGALHVFGRRACLRRAGS